MGKLLILPSRPNDSLVAECIGDASPAWQQTGWLLKLGLSGTLFLVANREELERDDAALMLAPPLDDVNVDCRDGFLWLHIDLSSTYRIARAKDRKWMPVGYLTRLTKKRQTRHESGVFDWVADLPAIADVIQEQRRLADAVRIPQRRQTK